MKILKSNILHHYPFELGFLKDNQDYIDFDLIVWNEYLKWSIEEFDFVRKRVKYPLELIFRNSKIVSNDEIVLKYLGELNPEHFEYGSGVYPKWDEDMLNIFAEKVNIGKLSPVLEVSTEFLEREKERIDWESLSYNTQIEWTAKFIEKNKSLLDWRSLSTNSSLPWSEELIDEFRSYWNWDFISQNYSIDWTEQLINKYDKRLNWKVLSHNPNANFTVDFVERNIDKIDFGGLSRNKKIEWSKKFINKYEDKFIFGNYGLSWNFSLPWDEELIDKYKGKWSWSGISANRGISWDLEVINLFYDDLIWGKNDEFKNSADEGHRRNGFCLSNNPSLPWSIDFIKKFESRLDSMTSNYGVWEKVIKPIVTDEMVKEIIKPE